MITDTFYYSENKNEYEIMCCSECRWVKKTCLKKKEFGICSLVPSILNTTIQNLHSYMIIITEISGMLDTKGPNNLTLHIALNIYKLYINQSGKSSQFVALH